MSDVTTATVRTTVPAVWTAILVAVAHELFDWHLDPTQVAAAIVVALPFVYRLGRLLEARWPSIGYVLFGSAKVPSYPTRGD